MNYFTTSEEFRPIDEYFDKFGYSIFDLSLLFYHDLSFSEDLPVHLPNIIATPVLQFREKIQENLSKPGIIESLLSKSNNEPYYISSRRLVDLKRLKSKHEALIQYCSQLDYKELFELLILILSQLSSRPFKISVVTFEVIKRIFEDLHYEISHDDENFKDRLYKLLELYCNENDERKLIHLKEFFGENIKPIIREEFEIEMVNKNEERDNANELHACLWRDLRRTESLNYRNIIRFIIRNFSHLVRLYSVKNSMAISKGSQYLAQRQELSEKLENKCAHVFAFHLGPLIINLDDLKARWITKYNDYIHLAISIFSKCILSSSSATWEPSRTLQNILEQDFRVFCHPSCKCGLGEKHTGK